VAPVPELLTPFLFEIFETPLGAFTGIIKIENVV
jgi:hypothetical protein